MNIIPNLALFVGAFALSSGSKEKKIERNLHKVVGEWNIAQLDHTTTTGFNHILRQTVKYNCILPPNLEDVFVT